MKRHLFLKVLILAVCILLISISAFAAIKCVNTTGSSGCYVTISGAVGAANPGDTIVVWPGRDNGNVTVAKNNLTITGGTSPYSPAPPGNVIVDPYRGCTGPTGTTGPSGVVGPTGPIGGNPGF